MIPEDALDSGGLPAILDKGERDRAGVQDFKGKGGKSQVDRERITLWLTDSHRPTQEQWDTKQWDMEGSSTSRLARFLPVCHILSMLWCKGDAPFP